MSGTQAWWWRGGGWWRGACLVEVGLTGDCFGAVLVCRVVWKTRTVGRMEGMRVFSIFMESGATDESCTEFTAFPFFDVKG